jgi:hypothetical protein
VSDFFYADCGCIGTAPLLTAAVTIWGITAWHLLRKLYRSHTAAENDRNTTPEGRRSKAPLEE